MFFSSSLTISFQQNLNHYFVKQPGQLVADLAMNSNPTEQDFKAFGNIIQDINALNEITQVPKYKPLEKNQLDCQTLQLVFSVILILSFFCVMCILIWL